MYVHVDTLHVSVARLFVRSAIWSYMYLHKLFRHKNFKMCPNRSTKGTGTAVCCSVYVTLFMIPLCTISNLTVQKANIFYLTLRMYVYVHFYFTHVYNKRNIVFVKGCLVDTSRCIGTDGRSGRTPTNHLSTSKHGASRAFSRIVLRQTFS